MSHPNAEAAKLAALDMMPMDLKAPLAGWVADEAFRLKDADYDLTRVTSVPQHLEDAFNLFSKYYAQFLASHGGEGAQIPDNHLTWPGES